VHVYIPCYEISTETGKVPTIPKHRYILIYTYTHTHRLFAFSDLHVNYPFNTHFCFGYILLDTLICGTAHVSTDTAWCCYNCKHLYIHNLYLALPS